MAGSLNKVMLIGNLGKDPEVRTFQNGGRIANFSIATSRSWKDKTTGERKDKTEWHNIDIQSEHLVGVAEKYLRKGSKVFIEGQLETRKWTDQNGQDRYTTSVVLRPYNGELTMLDKKGEGEGNYSGGYSAPSNDSGMNTPPQAAASSGGGAADLDDDIPF